MTCLTAEAGGSRGVINRRSHDDTTSQVNNNRCLSTRVVRRCRASRLGLNFELDRTQNEIVVRIPVTARGRPWVGVYAHVTPTTGFGRGKCEKSVARRSPSGVRKVSTGASRRRSQSVAGPRRDRTDLDLNHGLGRP